MNGSSSILLYSFPRWCQVNGSEKIYLYEIPCGRWTVLRWRLDPDRSTFRRMAGDGG